MFKILSGLLMLEKSKKSCVMPTRIYQVFDAYLRIVPTITNTWRPTPIDNPQLKHITIFILQILLKKRRKGYFAWWRHSQGTFMDKELNMMVLQSVEIVGWIETCAVKDVAYYIIGDFNYTNVSSVASNETNEDLILQFWELAKVPTNHPWRENFRKILWHHKWKKENRRPTCGPITVQRKW